MDKNILWITASSFAAALFCIGMGLSLWNRRLTKAVRERDKFARAFAETKSQMASWTRLFPGAIYRCKPDPARTMVFISDGVLPITGYPAADFTARIRHLPHLIHPEDQALAAIQIEQGLKRARCFEVEYRIQRKDGEIRRIMEKGVGSGRNGNPDAGGGYAWIDGMIMDITGPRQNEEALRRINGMFRSLIDATPDFIFFKDRKGVYLECNKAFAASAGKDPEAIIGKTDYDLFSKESADRFRESDLKMLSKMKPRRSRGWLSQRDGQRALMETRKTPLVDGDGKVIGLVGVSRDVAVIKRLTDEVRRLKAEG